MTHSKGDSLEMNKSRAWLCYRARTNNPQPALAAHTLVLRGFVGIVTSPVSHYASLLREKYWVIKSWWLQMTMLTLKWSLFPCSCSIHFAIGTWLSWGMWLICCAERWGCILWITDVPLSFRLILCTGKKIFSDSVNITNAKSVIFTQKANY